MYISLCICMRMRVQIRLEKACLCHALGGPSGMSCSKKSQGFNGAALPGMVPLRQVYPELQPQCTCAASATYYVLRHTVIYVVFHMRTYIYIYTYIYMYIYIYVYNVSIEMHITSPIFKIYTCLKRIY